MTDTASQGSGRWQRWLAIAATAGLAAGAGYILYKSFLVAEEEEEEEASAVLKRLGAEAQAESSGAAAQPKGGLGALPAKPAAPSSGAAPKHCAHCNKALTGLPLRCSQCKSTYYCSSQCQKSAWSSHKDACKAKASTSAGTSQQAGDGASSSTAANEAGSSATTEAQDSAAPTSIQDALARLLQEQASAKGDSIEGAFEIAVMAFVQVCLCFCWRADARRTSVLSYLSVLSGIWCAPMCVRWGPGRAPRSRQQAMGVPAL